MRQFGTQSDVPGNNGRLAATHEHDNRPATSRLPRAPRDLGVERANGKHYVAVQHHFGAK
jgi:hypothetical protein